MLASTPETQINVGQQAQPALSKEDHRALFFGPAERDKREAFYSSTETERERALEDSAMGWAGMWTEAVTAAQVSS